MIVSNVTNNQNNQVASQASATQSNQGVTFTDQPASQATQPVSAAVQHSQNVANSQASNNNQTVERAQQQYVMPQRPVNNSQSSSVKQPQEGKVSQSLQNNINSDHKIKIQNVRKRSFLNESTKLHNTNNTPNCFAITTSNAPITDNLPQAKDNCHTPDYHVHDAQGWSNDVQTITQNSDGSYNIYFLHSVDGATNPFGPDGQDWEHVTTKDWIHFNDEGIAINSHGTNNLNSWKSAWTGSVITNEGNIAGVPKNAQVAYFSGLSKKDGSQNIWAAWSDDNGKTFTHALNDGAPVLAWNQVGASGKNDQERDADVIYWNKEMLMYCAEGDRLGVYKSTDGIHWLKADPNGTSKITGPEFFKGLNWTSADIPVECPQIRTMKTPSGQVKTVLFYGEKGASDNPVQTSGTYYIIGHLDQNGIFVPETNAHRLDLGSDYYGTNINGDSSLNDIQSNLIGLGWVGNWNYTSQGVYNNQNPHKYPADKSQLENHLGAYTLPRLLTLGNNLQIQATPDIHLNEGQTYTATTSKPSNGNGQKEDVGKDSNYGDVYDLIDHANDPASQVYNLHFNTTDGSNYQGRIYININQGKDRLTFNYDPDNGMMMVNGYAEELDNDISGSKASSAYFDGALGHGKGYLVNTNYIGNNGQHKQYDIEVFCDKTSIELFFPNGQVYTVARYATNDTQDFKVYTQDPHGVNQVTETKQSVIPVTQVSNCINGNKINKSGLFPEDSLMYEVKNDNKPLSNKNNVNKSNQNSSKPNVTGSQSGTKVSSGSNNNQISASANKNNSTSGINTSGCQSSSKVSASVSQSAVKSSSVSQSGPTTTSSANSSQSVVKKTSSSKSVITGNQSQGKENSKPISSASNLNNAHQNNNGSASSTVNVSQTGSVASSNANKPSLSQSLQIGNSSININQNNTGKGSLSVSAVSGKTSVVNDNNVPQSSTGVKDSASISKSSTTNRAQHTNGSVSSPVAKGSASKDLAKKSAAVSQSSVALQSSKGNQRQSQRQHVNVKKNPAKILKASSPVVQLAAKRNGCTPAGSSCQNTCKTPSVKICGNAVTAGTTPVSKTTEATTPVAISTVGSKAQPQQASVQTQELLAQGTQATASAVTSNVNSSSSASSNAMPATGMNNQLADELGVVGVGLVLGVAAKRAKKRQK